MRAKEIYFKTMKFVWMKLGLGLMTILASALLLGIGTGITLLFGSEEVGIFMILLWLGGTAAIKSVLMYYFGYLIKAGHIAVVTEAVKTGQLPADQVNYATTMVKERFATSNVYFVVDRLISGAVKQLQNSLDSVDNILGNIPGVSTLLALSKVFIGMALGYVDECCLGYTFYNKEQNAFKSAADGVVIYFQNWKKLLKNALVMSITIIIAVFVSTVFVFAGFGGLFTALGWNKFIGFVLAILISFAIKSAFIDSYMMIKMMVSYLEVAPQTEITFNLYEKLCKLSAKFKELFSKSGQKQNVAI